MKKIIKNIILFISFCIIVNIVSIKVGYAEQFTRLLDIPLNKEWKVKFNTQVNIQDVKDNIYIEHVYSKYIIPVDLSLTDGGKTVIVKPKENYKYYNNLYRLVIKNTAKNINGNKMKEDSSLEFVTMKEPSTNTNLSPLNRTDLNVISSITLGTINSFNPDLITYEKGTKQFYSQGNAIKYNSKALGDLNIFITNLVNNIVGDDVNTRLIKKSNYINIYTTTSPQDYYKYKGIFPTYETNIYPDYNSDNLFVSIDLIKLVEDKHKNNLKGLLISIFGENDGNEISDFMIKEYDTYSSQLSSGIKPTPSIDIGNYHIVSNSNMSTLKYNIYKK